jgi:hypothetical protein
VRERLLASRRMFLARTSPRSRYCRLILLRRLLLSYIGQGDERGHIASGCTFRGGTPPHVVRLRGAPDWPLMPSSQSVRPTKQPTVMIPAPPFYAAERLLFRPGLPESRHRRPTALRDERSEEYMPTTRGCRTARCWRWPARARRTIGSRSSGWSRRVSPSRSAPKTQRRIDEDKSLGYTFLSSEDFLLDGKQLARTEGKLALQGYYVKMGAAERLFPSQMAAAFATQGATSVSLGVALLTDDAPRELRAYFLRCGSLPGSSQLGCAVRVRGHATMCERTTLVGSEALPCLAVEGGRF